MLQALDEIQPLLVVFLSVAGAALFLLLGYLFIQRAVRSVAERRRQRRIARYRPLVDTITQHGLSAATLTTLRHVPTSHHPTLSGLLLAPLHSTKGEMVGHVHAAASALGLVDQWKADLEHRHWWRRAEGARALGFVEDPSALPLILGALEDDHKEVRAAAVDAVGRLRDERAIPALLAQLNDGSQHQGVRVIDALSSLGPTVTPALIDLARTQPESLRRIADVLGMIGAPGAVDVLVDWCSDPRSEVRAAALTALGSLGLTDRSYYHVLKALGDDDPQARAMAARALGRSGRADAAVRLAARLDDEWLPAAQAAGALRQLGAPGRAALQARAEDQGQAGDLARQMLWVLQSAEGKA